MVRNQITDRVGCMIKRRKDMKRLGFVAFRLFYVKIINKNYKRIQKGYKKDISTQYTGVKILGIGEEI